MTPHVEPSDAQRSEVAAYRPDGPIIALNLNRYRERAAYPPGTPHAEVSGREAYLRYGIVAQQAIASVGGKILWLTEARTVAVGCEHERFNEVVAVWYPSRAQFFRIEEFPGYREAFELHRRAAIDHAVLLLCDGPDEPVLTSPFA